MRKEDCLIGAHKGSEPINSKEWNEKGGNRRVY
jgi:hypothetical protein